jgi:putative phosphoribosyl transferase
VVLKNREEGGKLLAKKLAFLKGSRVIVLALPRGGIVTGFEVARALQTPLNVLISRKIGSPMNLEFGIGAIAEGNIQVLDWANIISLNISKEKLKEIIENEKRELTRRIKLYRNNLSLPPMKNKTVILVDDGLATGVTARAAIDSIKMQKPKQIIFASPVCAHDAVQKLKYLVDKIICIITPSDLSSIGQWYKSFDQVSDEEVVSLLKNNCFAGV